MEVGPDSNLVRDDVVELGTEGGKEGGKEVSPWSQRGFFTR